MSAYCTRCEETLDEGGGGRHVCGVCLDRAVQRSAVERAAPDLLAALRELLQLGQQESIEDGELEAAQKAARAAIAKARGTP